MQTIDISQLSPQTIEILTQIQSGEELCITDHEQLIAKLILVHTSQPAPPQPRQIGLSNSVIWMSPDFNEPLEDFAEYM